MARAIGFAMGCACLIWSAGDAAASLRGAAEQSAEIAHGGGCRKDSPRGQCCHMDRKAGVLHCH